MQVSHNVKFEVLRHGPPHNQLLSPLTRYLGISGRHEAVTLKVPYEHRRFLTILGDLVYREKNVDVQRARLEAMALDLGRILAQVPGLPADITSRNVEGESLTHIRLVFSASELALLPFEMSTSPAGFPGEGTPLSLQNDVPLVMTREIRGASGYRLDWSRKPRILFVAAAPGMDEIPFSAHLLVLRKALEPWVALRKRGQSLSESVGEYLTVLPNACLSDIQNACAENHFTHIHILAHGAPCGGEHGNRFGLRLAVSPGRSGNVDVVSGERLANAIRVHRREPEPGLSRPLVATVASCDGGRQGSVIWPGSSLAQDLHEAGISFVVGSQFPLTKKGSVVMVDTLYRSLLWGKDPRVCMHELRKRLATEDDSHDWGSIVSYLSLPHDIAYQLHKLRILQANAAMKVALSQVHTLTDRPYDQKESVADPGSVEIENLKKNDLLFQQAVDILNKAVKTIPLDGDDADRNIRGRVAEYSEITATLGSAKKREAQALSFQSETLKHLADRFKKDEKEEDADRYRERCRVYREGSKDAVAKAMEYYRRAFEVDARSHWAMVQYLALKASQDDEFISKIDLRELWYAAYLTAYVDFSDADISKKAWGCGSLIELFFLSIKMDDNIMRNLVTICGEETVGTGAKELAVKYAGKLVSLTGEESFYVESTYWQFNRYRKWFKMGKEYEMLADEIIKILKPGGD